VCGEKRGLTIVACQVKRPWLPVRVMLSGLLAQNNPAADSPAEEADIFPILWTQIMPLASSDLLTT